MEAWRRAGRLCDRLNQILVETQAVGRFSPHPLRNDFDRERFERLVKFRVIGHQVGFEFSFGRVFRVPAGIEPLVIILELLFVFNRIAETLIAVAANR